MKTKQLNLMSTDDLMTHFKAVSKEAILIPFKKIQLKKFDAKNMRNLRNYNKAIKSYITCIQLLRRRNFTLLEIMDILQP